MKPPDGPEFTIDFVFTSHEQVAMYMLGVQYGMKYGEQKGLVGLKKELIEYIGEL